MTLRPTEPRTRSSVLAVLTGPDRPRAQLRGWSGPAPDTGPGRPVAVPQRRGIVRSWPVLVLAAPAAAAVWSGWVGIGQMTGFGQIRPLPGIWNSLHIDTAVTLPVGVEAYAAFALRAWLSSSPYISNRTRRFARWSSIAALALGMVGQVAYHLLTQAGMTRAPWEVTTLVSCLPVLVLGMGTALAHLLRSDASETEKSGDASAELPSTMRASESSTNMKYRRCDKIARGPFPGRHPAAAAGCGPAWSWRAAGTGPAPPVPVAYPPGVTGMAGRPRACASLRRGPQPRRSPLRGSAYPAVLCGRPGCAGPMRISAYWRGWSRLGRQPVNRALLPNGHPVRHVPGGGTSPEPIWPVTASSHRMPVRVLTAFRIWLGRPRETARRHQLGHQMQQDYGASVAPDPPDTVRCCLAWLVAARRSG
jgi:hypothetical protein